MNSRTTLRASTARRSTMGTDEGTTAYRTSGHHGIYGTTLSTSYSPDTTRSNDFVTESRPRTTRLTTLTSRGATRPATTTTTRPRTSYSTYGIENQDIVCAVSESRGISPTVGLAFINLDTGEAVLSQLNDSQTYVRTTHKLSVFNPSRILIIEGARDSQSKLFSIIQDNLADLGSELITMDRRYWNETIGLEYIQRLAFDQDIESIKAAVSGKYYTICCFAAVLKFTEIGLSKSFPANSLRIKYEPPEGSMMIDLATIQSLELVQNFHDARSKHCLFGLLNETLTPMGSRLLRSSILQPSTDPETLSKRYDAVEELSTKEDMFHSVRRSLKPFLDADKILTQLILHSMEPGKKVVEQSINRVLMLKHFVSLVGPLFESLAGARCEVLQTIRNICAIENTEPVSTIIDSTINGDVTFAHKPLDLRNQRTYAVKSGVNGLLDVARQTYEESKDDAMQHIDTLAQQHELPFQTKFDNTRQFFLRIRADELEGRDLPDVFINVFRKKGIIECQTLELVKRNQKIADAHMEVLLMSDNAIEKLIESVRERMFNLFKICESVAMLDVLASLAHVVTTQEYTRPFTSGTLAVHSGRHPIREKIHNVKFIPNDVYATQQQRFQLITGCNMSGKSTYIRSIALMVIMAQIGSFVPAQYAAFPIIRQLFARVSIDDSIEANVSTFAAEMREAAFILRNVDRSSLVIIDELGRGTSTSDGLAIATAISEALIESRCLVWFATHFRDLAKILAERNGVVNLHLAVDMTVADKMEMLYRISPGTMTEQHYGLKLAKVLPFPPDVILHAEHVSAVLERQRNRKRQHSMGIVHARRRKLILNLKEHLIQAKESKMDDEDLKQWLKDLQSEFVVRMTALDEEMQQMVRGGDAQDEEEESIIPDPSEVGGSMLSLEHSADGEDAKLAHLAESSTGQSTRGSASHNSRYLDTAMAGT